MSLSRRSTAPLALEEDICLEVPEEPDKEEDDDQDLPKPDSDGATPSGSMMNFLTGLLTMSFLSHVLFILTSKCMLEHELTCPKK